MTVRPQNFTLQPRQIIDAYSVLFTADRNENILTFEDLHLLKTSPADQLINFTLSTPVQQHQAVFGAD